MQVCLESSASHTVTRPHTETALWLWKAESNWCAVHVFHIGRMGGWTGFSGRSIQCCQGNHRPSEAACIHASVKRQAAGELFTQRARKSHCVCIASVDLGRPALQGKHQGSPHCWVWWQAGAWLSPGGWLWYLKRKWAFSIQLDHHIQERMTWPPCDISGPGFWQTL